MKRKQNGGRLPKEALQYMVKSMYDNAMLFSKSLAVETIQRVISDGICDPKELVADLNLDESVVVTALSRNKGMFQDTRSDERKRFDESIKKAFEGEQYFESSCNKKLGSEYTYGPASDAYMPIFYKLYQILSNKPYRNADQLMRNMRSALKGKRILELGCGPGFALPILESFGAKPVGIEQVEEYRGRVEGADIRYGDARLLPALIGSEMFDIIMSRDFLTSKILSKADALCVMVACTNAAVRGGLGVHQMIYEELHPDAFDFYAWLASRNGGIDYEEYKRRTALLSEEELSHARRTNDPALSEGEFRMLGFNVAEYAAEAGYFSIVLRNPK